MSLLYADSVVDRSFQTWWRVSRAQKGRYGLTMVYARDWDIPLCLLHGPATAYGLPSMVSTEDCGDCPASPASRLTRFEILARVIGRRFRRSGVV